MVELISFPFRLGNDGSVATNEEGSEQCYAEELAMLILTEPGERHLAPDYGVSDQSFGAAFDSQELIAKVGMFGPPVEIESVAVTYSADGTQQVKVGFKHDDDAYDSDLYENQDEEL